MHIAMPASRAARWLRVALLLAAPALAAQPQPAEAPESLVVAVTVNGEPRGDFFVFRDGAGEFLFRRGDLAGIAKLPPQIVPVMIEGEACLRLSELPGATSSFNERTLALDITLPAESFETQVLQLARHAGRAEPGDAQATSGLFNYRVAYADNDAGISSWTLAAEEVVTTRGWLARNQSYHVMGDAGDSSVRYETQLIRDDRAALRRLTLGDAFTGADELGGAVPLGGVSLVKAYQLAPYFIRRPGTGFAGAVTLPSEVELYVGGTRLLRERVAPGPFEIENVHHYGGQRDVRVVVRDMFGREQETSFPFYFADQGLAAGLHDYSYHLGFLREDFGIESNDYGDAAVAAFHRYGLDDAWTVGVRGEATADYGNLGPSLVYRNDALGVLSAVAAVSTDRVSGTGSALSLAHAWQSRDFAVLSSVREFSAAYATLHTGLPTLLRQDLGLAVTYAPAGFGSLSLALRRARTADLPESRSATLSYSRPLLRWFNLLASYRADFSQDGADEVFVNLLFLPRGGHTASTFARRADDGSHATGVQAGNTVPQGTGMAYRLSAQQQSDAMTSARSVAPEFDYYGRYGLLTLDAQQTEIAGQESSSYEVGLAGAVAAVGRRIDFSRPISDSFGLAEVTPAVGGVRVYQNGQQVGRTDDRGRVFLPQLTSFVDNSVTIDDRDIPIEYGVAATERIVAPAYRSGAIVSFAVTRTQAFTGVLVVRDRGRSEPLAYHLVTLMDGSGLNFPTGSAGEIYLENLAPGPHEATVTLGASECRFTVTIPDSAEAMVKLGEVVSCERRH